MESIKAKLTAVLASVALAVSLSVPAFAYEQVEDAVSYGHARGQNHGCQDGCELRLDASHPLPPSMR